VALQPLPRPPLRLVNQGGVDMVALGRKDLSSEMAHSGKYRVSFQLRIPSGLSDNYSQAVSSDVQSDLSFHSRAQWVQFPRPLWTASQTLPAPSSATRQELSTCPACVSTCSTGRSAPRLSIGIEIVVELSGRSEPNFHARNVGRFDLYRIFPCPLGQGGGAWFPSRVARHLLTPSAQVPDLTGANNGHSLHQP